MQTTKKYIGRLEECTAEDSALSINNGVTDNPNINPNIKIIKRLKLSTDDYFNGIIAQDINILSRAITLIESTLPEHFEQSQQIIERCLPYSGNSVRVGITGVPGVGKSTFIETLGYQLVNAGKKLAVLAIDPSSERNGGSILGDKTRMERLSVHARAFIRPSPSAGTLGGVARKTRESIILCEAAGFDTIFIETVGVGQSETSVHNMTDFFLLLMLAGAGDELQGIKRGIMEMSDAIVITKADENNEAKSNLAKLQYQNALRLFTVPESQWTPKVFICSAKKNIGINEIWNEINNYIQLTKSNGYYAKNRNEQAVSLFYNTINQRIKDDFYNSEKIKNNIENIKKQILNNEISSFQAAKILLENVSDKKD